MCLQKTTDAYYILEGNETKKKSFIEMIIIYYCFFHGGYIGIYIVFHVVFISSDTYL